MPFYNYHSNVFVNNTQNPEMKFDDIRTSITTLYDILMSGEMIFPRLDYEYIEMLYNINLIYSNTFKSLYAKEYKDGVATKTGYNPSKIAASSTTNLAHRLEEVDDDYKMQIIHLDQIYRRLNKNMDHHKLMGYVFGDIEQEFVTNQDFTKFKFTTKAFESIFKKDPYTDGQVSPNGVMAIPYIISYVLLFRLYSRAFNFPSNFLDDVYRNSFFSDERLPQEFEKYTVDYESDISYGIVDYMLNNIFLFGTGIAPDIRNTLKDAVSAMLPDLAQIFTDIKSDVVTTDFIFSFATDFNHHLVSQSALKHLNDSYYLSLNQFWQMDTDTLNYYSMEDDRILASFITYINANLETANDLVSISLSYTSQPLFFLNSFMLTYSQFTLNFIQDYDCFALSDVKSWMSRYYTPRDNHLESILNYITDHPLYYPGELFDHGCTGCTGGVGSFGHTGYAGCTGASGGVGGTGSSCIPIPRVPGPGGYNSCLELTAFLKFRRLILSYCDSSQFYTYITKTFIPRVAKAAKEKYYIEINWYMEVDKIISFFKVLFLRHLCEIDPATGKFKLWGCFIDDFDVQVTQHIRNARMLLTPGVLQNIISIEMQSSQTYYYIFNSFMKSASMAKYLELQLKKNYSL